jgi:hypothetical protein
VGGQHDAEPLLGDGLHQVLQELSPRQGVQAGQRLVQENQIRPLSDGEGQRELGALPAGQRPRLLSEAQVESLDSAARQLGVPARVEVRAQPQVVGHRQPGVDRRVLGQVPDPGQLCRAGRGPPAEHLDRARGRRQYPGGQVEQSRLPRPVRADQADDMAGRDREAAIAECPTPPVALAEPGGLEDLGHATPC